MWLAHALTLSRLVLAGLFWPVVDHPWWAVGVLALAGLTDVVDGQVARLARRRREQAGQPPPPPLGEWLDPLCDKTFVLSVLVALRAGPGLPLPLLLLIATREIILIPIAALYRFTPWLRSRMRYRFRAGPLGKAATVAQFLAITLVLFRDARAPLAAIAAAVIGAAAALAYVVRGVRLARAGRPALQS
jgi:cardiolipin synthase (CMP-forming)